MGSLAASVVLGPTGATAWVTSAAAGAGGPVQGATVWLYSNPYSYYYNSVQVGAGSRALMLLVTSNLRRRCV